LEQKHFILEFYDELVETVCQKLVFGRGKFEIAGAIVREPSLSYAYLRRAMSERKRGNNEEALLYYQKYIDTNPPSDSAEYARRCINYLKTGKAAS